MRILPALDAPSPKGIPDPPVNKAGAGRSSTSPAPWRRRYGRGGSFWSGRRARPANAFQIYNEQNGPAYWRARPNARKYGKLLRGASQAIRRKDRRAEIVLGGMFATPSGRGAMTSWAYLTKLYKVKKIKRAFDTVAVHPYSNSMRGIKYQVRKVRNVMKRKHDRKADMRVTEFGWGSARRGNLNKGRKGQARMLSQGLPPVREQQAELEPQGRQLVLVPGQPGRSMLVLPDRRPVQGEPRSEAVLEGVQARRSPLMR